MSSTKFCYMCCYYTLISLSTKDSPEHLLKKIKADNGFGLVKNVKRNKTLVSFINGCLYVHPFIPTR